MAGYTVAIAGLLGSTAAARAADPSAHDAPRVLFNTGPTLRPANRAATDGQAVARGALARSGPDCIKQAYQRSQSAQTPADYTSVVTLCQEGIALGVTEETRTYARQLLSWAHNRRGEAAAAAGQDAEALRDFDTAVQYDKTRWRALHNRGVSRALAGQYAEAIADFSRTIELNPQFANAYFNRAEMRYELGQFAAAIEDYTRALQLAPDDSAAQNSRGHAYFQLGAYRAAISDFTAALAISPDNAAALTNRGDVLAELGYYAEALRDYHQSLSIDKRLGRTHQSIAWLVATCPDETYRDAQLALSAARRAIELDGDSSPRYLDTLAAAYAEAGNFREAQQAMQQAIDMAPEQAPEHYRKRLALYAQARPYRSVPKQVAAPPVAATSPPPSGRKTVQSAAHAVPDRTRPRR
ncbi:MAG: hypothetical protein A2W31_12820 [Planctomycetes bacterium RBG_16_64_10]|nr:MAG: hypothetical protein A2W31_12820 [Planctomycetes bacterium RBG_16_64_10]